MCVNFLPGIFDCGLAKASLADSAAGYSMEHSARVFLVDGNGRLRLSYAYGTPAGDIVQDIRYLLQQ